ncbi:MAG: rhomboid family intramembrane serine protease [Ferruginibacter sp.]|nr:rhomboid family intramembrane serine protease [Bacteroidota bacterium]MCW5917890.1 rhomboid family intramembrane serine protease [Ferruginibacter sp.]
MGFDYKSITVILIAINVIISLIGFSNRDFMRKLIMWPYGVKRQQQYYRMVSSGFLHADYIHLFFNMFTLYFFGTNLEFIFSQLHLGSEAAYLLLYFMALVVSDLPSYLKHQNDSGYQSLGASGAVSAVVFAVILFNPWGAIYIYGAIKISALVYAVLYIIYCVYMGKQGTDHINHDAHLWGAVFGLLFAIVLVAFMNPGAFQFILDQLKNPSLFGR